MNHWGEVCPQCLHFYRPHLFIGANEDRMGGGIVLCPEPRCECFATWGVKGHEVRLHLDRFEIAALREQIQS